MASPQSATSTQQADGKRSVSGGDFVLLVLLVIAGFGVWFWVERTLTELLHYREPNEERLMFERGITAQQAELTRAQNEIDELQRFLNAAQLEQIKQQANVSTLVSANPELASPDSASKAPADLVKSYWEARRQEVTGKVVVRELEERLQKRKAAATAAAAVFQTNKFTTQADFHRAHARYLLLKPLLTLLVVFVVVFVLLLLVDGVLWLSTGRRIAKTERFQPYLIVIALLLVLFGYQAFELAGAALIGIVVLIVLLRKIDWPRKTRKADALVK
jgi:hypothetical protein